MKRTLLTLCAALCALPLLAQQAAPASAPTPEPKKIVASVNGEVITQEKLDQLYDRLGTQMRAQYEKTGGKAAFLENYLRKRLVVQEAIKAGFDKRPDVRADMDASAESTLFDRYVRDVISAPIVSETEMRKYYDAHLDEFATPEQIKVRHIVITPTNVGPNPKTDAEAHERIQQIAAELHQQNTFPNGTDPSTMNRLLLDHFAAAAHKYSEDGAAPAGGDLGWVQRGMLDGTFEEAAFKLRKGTMSGIVQTKFGYHLIFVEDTKAAGTEPYDQVKPQLREYLMNEHASEVMQQVSKLTNELRASSKISTYPENVK